MAHGTYTFWQMTINNYTPTDVALVQQGYPDDIRQLVYTYEEGEQGTPHIQAFIHMKRQVRMSHMSKLFPRARFRFLESAEYRLNAQRYAQKLDGTARSPAIIQNSDPLHTIEGTVRRVMEKVYDLFQYDEYTNQRLHQYRLQVERQMVWDDYTMAKVFVSSTYKQMWRQYGEAMYSCIHDRLEAKRKSDKEDEEKRVSFEDTHTHTQPEIFSREGGITSDEDEGESQQEPEDDSQEGEDGEGDLYSSGSEDEADTESSDSGCSEYTSESED